MDPKTRQTRRRLLGTAAATVSAVALAGCGGPGEENGNGMDPEDDPAGEEDPGEDPDAEEGTGNGQEMEDDADDL
ncbi:twin-arginine translocation signal domain-containing protein [Natrarchaeobius chitinivorans]|uniref:Twin-arginine translocation signal domain-containing protein n=1 Tax=Natrarchaeobius chitinivorans TaxID=1679083 RepID=A0A3N6LRB5_NATCH|nr:twin-arginine translocation signal domain-containing protein [Natrarchaeobius chitinivorans]RQG92258.1 twin-arginine translocation signal domain-containing protein [Natrarchaeobius chitinivorans]